MRAIAYIDGGSRGNPGLSGIGITIEYPELGLKLDISKSFPMLTNNQAEYMALLYALEYANFGEALDLTVYSDSELVVKQINGQYECKNSGLLPHYTMALTLIPKFNRFELIHIPREKNMAADSLANAAMDRATV